MSNDLSNQLRSLNTFEWMARPATTKQICFDAADRIETLECEITNNAIHLDVAMVCMLNDQTRIEKLESALSEIIIHCDVPAPPNAEALKMFARKALEGKDD